jgi:hypothetical protein
MPAKQEQQEWQRLCALGTPAFAGRAGLRIAAGFPRDGLVMPADLGQVGGLELQREFHQRVCDIRGSFIRDSIFGQPD